MGFTLFVITFSNKSVDNFIGKETLLSSEHGLGVSGVVVIGVLKDTSKENEFKKVGTPIY